MAGDPVFTSQTCYHGSPADTQRKLQSGTIRGIVNEGTPDARVVRFDLRGATGSFKAEQETTTQASAARSLALGAPMGSIGRKWDAENDGGAFPNVRGNVSTSYPRGVFELLREWAGVGQSNGAVKVTRPLYPSGHFFDTWSLTIGRSGGEGPPSYLISISLADTHADVDAAFTFTFTYSIFMTRVESLDGVIDEYGTGDDESGKEVTAGMEEASDLAAEIVGLLIDASASVEIRVDNPIVWHLELRTANTLIKPARTGHRAVANASSSAMPIGFLLWWWWWWPWWWWWWATPVENVRLEGGEGGEAAAFSGTVRIGVRERGAGMSSSSAFIGCADGGGDADRYSLGLIEITTSDGSVPLRVTSAFVESPPPPVRAIARIECRTQQVPGALWDNVDPEPGAMGKMEVTVESQNANANPWAGQGFEAKYAIKVGSSPARQGLRLWLKAGEEYIFEAQRVPTQHPFHLTRDGTGGLGAPQDARLTDAVHAKTKNTLLSYKPQASRSLLRQGAYYQCTIHDKMGGPINIYKPEAIPMLADDISGSVVMHNKRTGKTVVVGADFDETEFDTVGAALDHLGLELNTPAAFRLGEDIAPDSPDLCCATLKKREGGDDLYEDAHAPAVLVSKHGDHYCNHIHSLAEIRAWLQERKPDGSSQLCPHCA